MIPACGRLQLKAGSSEPDDRAADLQDLRGCISAKDALYTTLKSRYMLYLFLIGAEKAILDGATNSDALNKAERIESESRSGRLHPVTIPQ